MRVIAALAVFAVGMVVLFVGFIVLNVAISSDEPIDCAGARDRAPRWEQLGTQDRSLLYGQLSSCSLLREGQSEAEVEALLPGPVRAQGFLVYPIEGREVNEIDARSDALAVAVRGGRVVAVEQPS